MSKHMAQKNRGSVNLKDNGQQLTDNDNTQLSSNIESFMMSLIRKDEQNSKINTNDENLKVKNYQNKILKVIILHDSKFNVGMNQQNQKFKHTTSKFILCFRNTIKNLSHFVLIQQFINQFQQTTLILSFVYLFLYCLKMLQKQLKTNKTLYSEFMSQEQRRKCQRYTSLIKDYCKLESELNISWKDHNMFGSLRKELKNFFRSIENGYKFNLSDYEAFLWKIGRQKNIQEQLSVYDNFKMLNIQAKNGKIDESELNNIDFPVLSMKVSQLCLYSTKILMSNSFCNQNYTEQILFQLIKCISMEYNVVSYHNFSHAFSLQLQLYQTFNRASILQKFYHPFQIGIAYIVALAHDMNHRGTNSNFEIQQKTQMALQYNYESVLENMHVSQFYKLIRENSKIDIFTNMKNVIERQKAKRLTIKLILATDIFRHFGNLNLLKSRIQNTEQNNKKPLNFEVFEDRQFVLEHIFHSCDIGNPTLSFGNYMNWAILLSYEFNTQTILEEENKLEVTEMLRYKGLKSFYEGQLGFINYLVLPQWKLLGQIFPELNQQFVKNVQKNVEQLQRRKSQILENNQEKVITN